MPYIDLDTIAVHLQKDSISDFTEHESTFLAMIRDTVESSISQHFVDLNGSGTKTEFLPVFGRNFDSSLDLIDLDINAGRVTPVIASYGTDVLILSYKPVLQAGLVVHEKPFGYAGQGSAFGAEDLLTLGVDYYLDIDVTGRSSTGILRRINGSWSTEARSVRITYSHGSATLSDSDAALIRFVILQSVAHHYRFWKSTFAVSPNGLAISSESIGKYSYSSGSSQGQGSFGNTFGGFGPIIPDEIAVSISHLFNWGAVI